jgi:hypothetical protein
MEAGWKELVAELETQFTGWHVWRSSAGRWWATRTGVALSRQELGLGRVMTVDADDPESLRTLLRAQTTLDRDG